MKLKNYFPVIILAFISILIGFLNYKSGTWLTGWDNLHPEFNFFLNIKRSVFAVWQEYQGLGLLGGMGHASDLPRQLILFVFSLFVKTNYLRYIWISLMLIIGPIGVYQLLQTVLPDDLNIDKKKIYGFLGGLFYLLNLATVQIFYVPFEAFVTHYGFLPWLLALTFSYLKTGDKKTLIYFIILSLIGSTQAYVPTLFVVYCMALLMIFISEMFKKNKIQRLKKILALVFATFIINAYWLMPFLYFTATSSSVVSAAKENYMATDDIYLRNKEFGTIPSVALIKGFWFKFVDYGANRELNYMIDPWLRYLSSPVILLSGYFFFFLILLGLLNQFKKRSEFSYSLILLFMLPFSMLLTDTFPFSELNNVIRSYIPLFSQVFRVPFTKFAILTSLSYSILFAYGVSSLVSILEKYYKRASLIILPILILIFIYTIPIFQGKLFYDNVKLKIPDEYFETFKYFSNKGNSGRVANFPQASYWGWNHYSWGGRGSGFIWYGIENPILDRAFDGYSASDENYYWELSQTVYSGNQEVFEKLLDKYQISWLLVDDNVISFSSQKEIIFSNLNQILDSSSKISLEKQFGKIRIYRVTLDRQPNNFVFLASDLPVVGPEYKWNNYDRAFEEYGNYITNQQKIPFVRDSLTDMHSGASESDLSFSTISYNSNPVNSGVDLRGVEPLQSDLTDQIPHRRRPTQNQVYQDNNGAINQVFAEDSSDSPTVREVHYDIYYPETIEQSSSDNLLSGRAGFFVESDIDKKNNNKSQTESNSGISIDIPKVSFIHDSNFPSILADNIKHTIPNTRSTVNTNKLDISNREPKLGAINTAPNQPEARLINRDENTLNHGFGIVKPIYAKDTQSTINNQQLMIPDIYYPFRSLFTGRRQEELEFGVEDSLLRQGFGGQEGAYFSFKTKIPKSLEGAKLVIPKFGNEIFNVGEINLDNIVSKDPQVFLDGELIQIPPPLHLAGVMASQVQPATPEVKINSEVSLTLTYIKEGNLEVRVPKVGGLYSYDSNITYDVFENVPKTCDQFNKGLFSQETVVENNTKFLKLTSVGSSNCLDIDLGHLAQRYGYLLTVESKNWEGKSLLISVINKNSQRADLETYLPSRHSGDSEQSEEDSRIDSGPDYVETSTDRQARMTTSFFILPPMEPDAIGYTLHFDNTSIGRVKTVNDLGRITVNPIPYKFLTSLKIVTDAPTFKGSTLKGDIKVDHPNPSFYKVDLASDSTLTPNTYMVLSQSFDKGWKAYEISCQLSVVSCQLQKILPFLFAKEIKNHVLINNWENGWDLSSTSYNLQPVTIIIVYLPQYLEYLGFALLIIFLGFLFLTREKKYFHGIKIEPIVN